jgi:hypothetical protein
VIKNTKPNDQVEAGHHPPGKSETRWTIGDRRDPGAG